MTDALSKTSMKPALLFIFVLTATSAIAEEDAGRNTLLYGMETDVLSLLGDLRRELSTRYNDLIAEIFAEFQDSRLLQAIYQLWEDTEYKEGLPYARMEMEKALGDFDYSPQVVQSALSFIAKMKDDQSVPDLLELVSFQNPAVAASAVRTLGKTGLGETPESADILLKRLQAIEDIEAEDDLSTSLILTLGELRYLPAAEYILLIAEDEASPNSHRQYACIALGKIGREEDYEAVKRIYEESGNAMLRSYALGGLTDFQGHDDTSILVHALKRDPFWRIRLAAAEKLADRNSAEVEALLRYKAANDPVMQIRIASIKSLGDSSDGSIHSFLLDYLSDDVKSTDTRLAALNTLVENHIAGTVNTVSKLMDKLWEKDQGRFLEFVCRELSTADWAALEPLYSRMLTHSNWLLIAYGIRGIYKNNLIGLYGKIAAMDTEGTDSRIRREIKINP